MKSLNLVLGMLLLLGAADSSADVVLTENFELPDTANFMTFNAPSSIVTATNTWQVTVSGVDLFEDAARPEAVAFDGGQAVDLAGSPGAGVISTTLATTPGRAYELTFHYGRNLLIGATTADALVHAALHVARGGELRRHDRCDLDLDLGVDRGLPVLRGSAVTSPWKENGR